MSEEMMENGTIEETEVVEETSKKVKKAKKSTEVSIVDTGVEEVFYDLKDIKERANAIGSKASDISSKIAGTIKVGNLDTNASMEAFKDLASHTKNLKPSGFTYSALKLARNIPGIGSSFGKAHDAVVNEYMNSETVNTVIDNMFDGMTEKSDELKERALKFLILGEDVEVSKGEAIEFKEELELLISKLMEDTNIKKSEVYQLELVLAAVMKKIVNYNDLLKNLENSHISITGLAQQMDASIPATKEDLKIKFIIASSLDESNKVMEQFMALTDIKEELNFTVQDSILDSMNQSLELDKKQVDFKKREKRNIEYKKKEEAFIADRIKTQDETTKMLISMRTEVNQIALEYKKEK